MYRSAVLLGMVIAVGLIGIGHADAQLSATVDIFDAECDKNENISALSLRVDYGGDRPVEATIRGWMQRDRVRMAWATPVLDPGLNHVSIEAPSNQTVFRYGQQGQIMVSVGQRRSYAHFERGVVC